MDTPERRVIAARLASAAALTTMIFAAVLFIGQHAGLWGSATTIVSVTTVETTGSTAESSETIDQEGHEAVDSETTTTTDEPATTETTTVREWAPDDYDWFGLTIRSVPGQLALEFIVVLLLGFLAGAVVQRIYLGRYGIKLGDLEFPDLPSIVVASIPVIEVGDIPSKLAPLTREGDPWWTIRAPLGDDIRVDLIFQRIQIEGGLRELAQIAGVEMRPELDLVAFALSDRHIVSPSLASAVVRLVELGNRLIAGAPLATGVDVLLRSALSEAQDELAGRIGTRS